MTRMIASFPFKTNATNAGAYSNDENYHDKRHYGEMSVNRKKK
jgi:hypothetical protein